MLFLYLIGIIPDLELLIIKDYIVGNSLNCFIMKGVNLRGHKSTKSSA